MFHNKLISFTVLDFGSNNIPRFIAYVTIFQLEDEKIILPLYQSLSLVYIITHILDESFTLYSLSGE